MASAQMKQLYPWLDDIVVANAPMARVVGAKLATQVSIQGGFGFIGAGLSTAQLEEQLAEAKTLLQQNNISGKDDTLAIGVGVLTFAADLKAFTQLVEKYRPAAVWLFGAKQLADYGEWSTAVRKACSATDIWIQIGSVAGAIDIAKQFKPAVLVAQGIDAGGHGFEKGASIVSLVPEMSDALEKLERDRPLLLAAGGIADGRGVAAAVALGAQGAVLGTRFLGAEETKLHDTQRNMLLHTADGGQNTVRAKVFDELRGPNIWPAQYDGRSVVTKSYVDFQQGTQIDKIREMHKEAESGPDSGYGTKPGEGMAVVWAGTGVGLVRTVQKARDIVREVRDDAIAILSRQVKL